MNEKILDLSQPSANWRKGVRIKKLTFAVLGPTSGDLGGQKIVAHGISGKYNSKV
jgi:hypothetical protein